MIHHTVCCCTVTEIIYRTKIHNGMHHVQVIRVPAQRNLQFFSNNCYICVTAFENVDMFTYDKSQYNANMRGQPFRPKV